MHIGSEYPLQLAAVDAANAAKSHNDFSVCCKMIEAVGSDHRGRALDVLTKQFKAVMTTMPVEDVLPTCSALTNSLNNMLVGEGSAARLARPLTAVFDVTHRLIAHALSEAETGKLTIESFSRIAADVTPAMLELDKLIGKHGMAKLANAMDTLLDAHFQAGNVECSFMMAAMSFPKHMASLEPGVEATDQVVATMTKLATLANGDRGLALITDDISGWRSWLLAQIEKPLGRHGIVESNYPALHGALEALRNLPAPAPAQAP